MTLCLYDKFLNLIGVKISVHMYKIYYVQHQSTIYIIILIFLYTALLSLLERNYLKLKKKQRDRLIAKKYTTFKYVGLK